MALSVTSEPTWRSSPGYGSTFHPVHTTVKEVQTKALTKAPCVVSKSHERSTSKAKMTTGMCNPSLEKYDNFILIKSVRSGIFVYG